MKKFIISLIILLIIAGAGFFAGWAQFKLSPLSYGVIISKIYGIDPTPVRSGEFRWLWYKLIPTNVQIMAFDIEQKEYPLHLNNSLPSGNTYSTFAGLGIDFSWEIKAVFNFRINPDFLVTLVKTRNIKDQEGLNIYEQEIAKGIELIILRTFSSGEISSQRLESILSGNRDIEIENEIKNKYPEIRDFSLVMQTVKFPDFALYNHVRLLYEEFLLKQREYIMTTLGKKAEANIDTQLRFEELARYGELLSKYPVLLDYLSLDKNN
jgi:hypothetical protein